MHEIIIRLHKIGHLQLALGLSYADTRQESILGLVLSPM